MSKTIEIEAVLGWIHRYPSEINTLEALEDWLKLKMWEPKVGEVCEFSDNENFPDSETYVGYFAGKTTDGFLTSYKRTRFGKIPYLYARPIKGGGE